MSATDGRLSRSALLYEQVIASYLDSRFVARGWLADRVMRHLCDPECRFVLVSGGPGTGKSAFLAWMTGMYELSPRYFLRRLSSHPLASGDAWSVLLSIGHQLAVLRPDLMRTDLQVEVAQSVGRVAEGGRVIGVRVGLLQISPFQNTAVQVEQHADKVSGSMVALEVDRVVADVRLNDLGNLQALALLAPAERLATQDPDALIVIFVDALDELRYQWSAFAGRGDVLEWLAQCPELPSNVRVVVSSRPDYQLLHRFRLAQAPRLREVPIEPDGTEVRADLAQYVARLLAEPLFDGLPDLRREGRTGLANRVVDRAKGSFLYLGACGTPIDKKLSMPRRLRWW